MCSSNILLGLLSRLADKQCSKSLLSSSPPNSTADIDRDKLEQKDVFSFFCNFEKTAVWQNYIIKWKAKRRVTSASLIICYKFIMKLRRLLECKILNKKNRLPEFEVDQADRMISELHIHSTTSKQPEYRRNFFISELFQEVIIFRLIILHIRLGVRRSNKIITRFNKKRDVGAPRGTAAVKALIKYFPAPHSQSSAR